MRNLFPTSGTDISRHVPTAGKCREMSGNVSGNVGKCREMSVPLGGGTSIGNADTQSSNTADKARLDISAVGVWSQMERTFFDVRVFHPNSASYIQTSPQQLYIRHEREKKRTYNDRVIQVEKGSFSPLIFSTTGGMGPESTRYHKKLAELISVKRGEEYSHVVNHIRTRIRFALLRCTLIAIRGERGKRRRRDTDAPLSEISFNLIPEQAAYET